jgi:uncharacterized protein YegL
MPDVKGQLLPIYLVADESGSMTGFVDELNAGLASLIDALNLESLAAAKVRLCVIGFSDSARCLLEMGDVRTVRDAPRLSANGGTSYAAAIAELLHRIPEDVDRLKAEGYRVHRPAVFFLTDGQPTDSGWEPLLDQLMSKGFPRPNLLTFGLGQVDAKTIVRLASRDDFAFIAAKGTDTGEAIARFCESLTQSIVSSGQNLAAGHGELVVKRPEGFEVAMDFV